MFARNMMADLLGRSAYSQKPGDFVPYFQYKIGDYQPDYYLYFPKEPYLERYYNEFFNKLFEYRGYDIINYLELHFSAYADKAAFLHFIYYDIQDRLKRKIGVARRQKLETALGWVNDKKEELKASHQVARKTEIERDVRNIVSAEANSELLIKELTARFSTYVDKLMADTEEKLSAITERIPSGSIERNNRNHEEKIIQLFILLQQVHASSQQRATEQLFKKFTALDIATILHLHFKA